MNHIKKHIASHTTYPQPSSPANNFACFHAQPTQIPKNLLGACHTVYNSVVGQKSALRTCKFYCYPYHTLIDLINLLTHSVLDPINLRHPSYSHMMSSSIEMTLLKKKNWLFFCCKYKKKFSQHYRSAIPGTISRHYLVLWNLAFTHTFI